MGFGRLEFGRWLCCHVGELTGLMEWPIEAVRGFHGQLVVVVEVKLWSLDVYSAIEVWSRWMVAVN